MRYLSLALLLLLLLLQPGFAGAAEKNDKDTELQNLYSTLNMLNQEQQAIYQQFQMLQEVRRSNLPFYGSYGSSLLPPLVGAPANYDEVVAAQKNAIQHDADLSRQANQLLDKFNEIEEMKKPIRQRIHSLTLNK